MMIVRHGVPHKVCFDWRGAFVWMLVVLGLLMMGAWVR